MFLKFSGSLESSNRNSRLKFPSTKMALASSVPVTWAPRLLYFQALFLLAILFGLAFADVHTKVKRVPIGPPQTPPQKKKKKKKKKKSYCTIDEPCSTHMFLDDAPSNKSVNYSVCFVISHETSEETPYIYVIQLHI